MADCLPSDALLLDRQDVWESMLKKYSFIDHENELNMDDLSDFVVERDRNESAGDKENVPKEALEVTSSEEEHSSKDENLNKQLQVAIKEREKQWNEKGLSFTFDKVDEWLKASEVHKNKLSLESNGTKHFESLQCKRIERKRSYRSTNPVESSNESEMSDSFFSSHSDVSVPSSVDTAQYIRANQKRRTSKVTKTIIKKYIVTSERYHKSNNDRQLKPRTNYNAIMDGNTSNPKRKRKKKKHLLDRLHNSITARTETSTDSDSEPLVPRKLSRLPRVLSKSNEHLLNSPKMQPKVILKRDSCASVALTKANYDTSASDISIASIQLGSNNKTNGQESFSQTVNRSRKSWTTLPKRVVIYEPNAETNSNQKVFITNEHFEKALGVEKAKEFMKDLKYSKEIDSNSMVILERPTTEEELSYSSDVDELDYFETKRPSLSVIPLEK